MAKKLLGKQLPLFFAPLPAGANARAQKQYRDTYIGDAHKHAYNRYRYAIGLLW